MNTIFPYIPAFVFFFLLPSLLFVLCLYLAFRLAAVEGAYQALPDEVTDDLEASGDKADKRLTRLLAEGDVLQASIVVARRVVQTLLVILGVAELVVFFGTSPVGLYGPVVLYLLLLGVLLYLVEMIPRGLSRHKPLQVLRGATCLMRMALYCFRWVAVLVVRIHRRFWFFEARHHELSPEELSKAIVLSDVEEEEKGMLTEIMRFYGKIASELMTPRVDMVALEYGTPYPEVLDFVRANGFSRIPVYQDRIDNITGILYAKDLLPYLDAADDFQWQSHMRPVFYAPETMRVEALLEAFREKKTHLAIVVDEFGGTSGLITMEDLLEEVVGEISDEYDSDDRLYREEPDGSYIFDAKISLVDFLRIVKMEPSETIEKVMEEVDTLGGMLLEVKKDFPTVGERLLVDGYEFIILEMGRHRIVSVRFVRAEQVEATKREE